MELALQPGEPGLSRFAHPHAIGAETVPVAELVEEIARHDALYYEKAQPEIADQDYDALERELAELETAHPGLASADSPTAQVGADHDERFVAAPHSRPMLSLQNSYDLAEVAAFDERVRRELGADAERLESRMRQLFDIGVEPFLTPNITSMSCTFLPQPDPSMST